jgi:Mg/Co/Ni transporter MgtE
VRARRGHRGGPPPGLGRGLGRLRGGHRERVVFGLLRAEELAKGNGEPVEAVMRAAPSTFRPHVPIGEMAHYMIDHDLGSSPITTSDGRLVGLLKVEDAARVAHEAHAHHSGEEDRR